MGGYASVAKFTLYLAQNTLCILCIDMSVRALPHSGIYSEIEWRVRVPMALPLREATLLFGVFLIMILPPFLIVFIYTKKHAIDISSHENNARLTFFNTIITQYRPEYHSSECLMVDLLMIHNYYTSARNKSKSLHVKMGQPLNLN